MKTGNKAGSEGPKGPAAENDADRLPAAPTQAQLANAEDNRLDALEEAELATEDRDGYRRELARVRAQVRELEGQLRAERHEHAETKAKLDKAQRWSEFHERQSKRFMASRVDAMARLSAVTTERDELKRREGNMLRVIEQHETARDCLSDKIADLTAQSADLAARLSAAETALADMTARADRAEQAADRVMLAGMVLASQNARLIGWAQ